MLFDYKRELAKEGATSTCGHCEMSVIARCDLGDMWYWHHESPSKCKEETSWQVRWKRSFPEYTQEQIRNSLVADVLFDGICYDFQLVNLKSPDLKTEYRETTKSWRDIGYGFVSVILAPDFRLRSVADDYELVDKECLPFLERWDFPLIVDRNDGRLIYLDGFNEVMGVFNGVKWSKDDNIIQWHNEVLKHSKVQPYGRSCLGAKLSHGWF